MSEFLVIGEEGEEFPASVRQSTSVLQEKVREVMSRQDLYRKPVCIIGYPIEVDEDGHPKQNKAASAVQSLRAKFGSTADVAGLTFASRKVRAPGTDVDQNGVWVHYDPNATVEGALEKFQAEQKAKVAKQNAKKKAADAKKAAEARKAS